MKLIYLTLLPLTICISTVRADFKEGGQAYLRGDYEAAANEFRPLADRGDHRAMYALGSMYSAGHGVEKDLTKSLELFTEAAKYGRPDAMYKLGLMYESGQGVTQDLVKAARNYQKSAKKGYPLGQYRLGLLYIDGKGVKKNLINAYSWLVIAGHYFIYNTYDPDKEIEDSSNQSQLLFFQEQEKDRVFDEIIKNLQSIKSNLGPEDTDIIRQKVIKLSKYRTKYHPERVKNIKLESNIESLFLPDTLY